MPPVKVTECVTAHLLDTHVVSIIRRSSTSSNSYVSSVHQFDFLLKIMTVIGQGEKNPNHTIPFSQLDEEVIENMADLLVQVGGKLPERTQKQKTQPIVPKIRPFGGK